MLYIIQLYINIILNMLQIRYYILHNHLVLNIFIYFMCDIYFVSPFSRWTLGGLQESAGEGGPSLGADSGRASGSWDAGPSGPGLCP